MALKLRRGTDSERTTVVFAEGEPVYVTDTGELYIGDGSTAGGLRVSNELELDLSPSLGGNLDLNQNNIVGTGNINIDGNITATGEITLGDGIEDNITVGGAIASSLIPDTDREYDLGNTNAAWRNGYFEGLTVDGEIKGNSIRIDSIFLDDSTPFITSESNTVSADSIESNSITGNILTQDSTLFFDSFSGNVQTDLIIPSENILTVGPNTIGTTRLSIIGSDDRGILDLTHRSDTDLTTDNFLYGALLFSRDDPNGIFTTSVIGAGRDNLFLAASKTGDLAAEDINNFVVLEDGNLTIGGDQAEAKLDVRGDAKVASSFQFGSLTTTERNALTAVNGFVIYNTTDNKFQGYQNGVWINLDDGTAA